MEKKYKILIGLFVLALLVRTAFVFVSPLRIWDETVYANLGYDLSINPFDYSFANNGWSDFIPSGGDSFYGWPKAGFRAPLLPYSLSLFYFFKIDFLILWFLPLIGALSVVLVYIFTSNLFNKKAALASAIFFMFVPLHVVYSSMILTDSFVTFFVIIIFICFWKGYENNNKNYKVLFGLFLALSLLARYTVLWIVPVFLIYFLIRDKSLKFLKDKHLWYAILVFFLTLIPWFLYGYFNYDNPLGAFVHGFKASSYWGGVQPWNFFFIYWQDIVSIIGLVFLVSLIYIIYKKDFVKKEIYLLLIWALFFLVMAMLMPHKEDRFILPMIPPVCILSGFVVSEIKQRGWRMVTILVISLLLLFSLYARFNERYEKSYTDSNTCFLEGNMFLNNLDPGALVMTDESTITYYYSKRETIFYSNPWSLQSLRNLADNAYLGKKVYILFSDFDMPLNNDRNIQIKEDLDANFKKVFECNKKEGLTIVYGYD